MDFYFKDKNQAMRFNEFLTCHVPAKVKYSRKLVSADHCSNVGDFKHNFLVDIAPICKVFHYFQYRKWLLCGRSNNSCGSSSGSSRGSGGWWW